MGRVPACGAVTWFAFFRYFELMNLRYFKLMKNGPSVSKSRWGGFFCLPSQTSGALASRWRLFEMRSAPALLARSEAIRRLVELGLKAKSKA
jgi:hypothetical protein